MLTCRLEFYFLYFDSWKMISGLHLIAFWCPHFEKMRVKYYNPATNVQGTVSFLERLAAVERVYFSILLV